MIGYVSIVSIVLYYLIFVSYYQMLVPAKSRSRILAAVCASLIMGAVYVVLHRLNMHWMSIPIILSIAVVGLRLSTGMTWLQACYGGNLCVLSAYCLRGIFASLGTLLVPSIDLFSDTTEHFVISLFSLPCSLLLFYLLRKKLFPDRKIKNFLHNRSELKLVLVYEVTTSIYMTFLNTGHRLSDNEVWFNALTIVGCLLSLGMLLYVIYQSIQNTEFFEMQLKNHVLEEQYERQLRHYLSYQKYTESFRAFKHDYKCMMGSLKSLIRMKDYDGALKLIDDIHDEMQNKVLVHKRYSDNVVLDAMLQDLANLCEAHQIRFSFQVLAPRDTALSTLDAIRLFANVTENAVEACLRVPVSERFINIVSGIHQQWVTLEVVNAYDGEILLENGILLTRKSDQQSHGLGMHIIKQILESYGGFILYNADQEKKTFMTRMHIPQQTK